MRIRLFLFSFFCILSILMTGQNTYPPYKQYTLRDGLSQMQVISLFQDSRGYIWVGTKEGLNCFNGEKIIRFAEKDGLANGYIQQITEDFGGNIWIVTHKGFSCYDGEKWKSYALVNILSASLAPTPNGKIWYLGSSQQMEPIFGYLENGKFHDQLSILPVLDNPGGSLIAYSKCSQALIFHDLHNLYELNNGSLKKLLHVPGIIYMEEKGQSILILETNEKNNNRLFEYNEGQIRYFATIMDDRFFGENRTVSEMTYIPWLDKGQIYTINPDTLKVWFFPDLHKNCCLIDRNNRLWIGTEEGLYQVYSGGFETYKREVMPAIWSIVEDQDQNLWFASYNFGLIKYNNQSVVAFPRNVLEKYEIRKDFKNVHMNFYFHPSADKRGTLYFPCNTGVLAYNGVFFKAIDKLSCLTTYYDLDRDLLWGGYRLFAEVYDKERKLVRTIGQSEGLEINGYVVTISKDNNGYFWLGGFTGLCRYNWDTKEIVNYNRSNGRLPADGIISTFNTPDGRTWFGSTHGLLWYDSKNDSIRKINSEEISGTVSFVTAIDSTWLVFSQSVGIYLMDLQKFNHTGEVVLHLFNEKNGFLGIDPGQDGAMVDSKGNIWMTTSTEVVKLDPKKLEFKKSLANVRISAFNGQLLLYNQNLINLPRNERSAVIQFDAICFNRPNQVQYSWKIEGSGKDWSSWQKEDYVVLSKLPDGQSLFQVRMKVPGLPQTEALATIGLTVDLALWKQEWFFPVLLGLVSLLVIFALILLYQTKAKMTIINRQARTFQLQAILSQMNPHFIFNVLASLQSMILSASIDKANDYLVKLANLIRGFLEASVSTSQTRTKNIEESELPLLRELEILNSYIGFQQLIYPEKFESELIIDPSIDTGKQTIPPMLIQPFVENSIRHGLLQKPEKGLLKISITAPEKHSLKIEIMDNGIGIKRAGELMLESRFVYTSRGRELTLNRIKLLNEMGYNILLDTKSSELGTTTTIKIKKDEY
jgi:ligand-binding sensor domain-containing protein